MLNFKSNKVLAIGEAMVEMAPVDDHHFRRGFAGDTFNTAWHMARALGEQARVGFVTKVGQDHLSDGFIAELSQGGVDTSLIGRDPHHTMGLYLIELEGAERSFHYWRKDSAARLLADDPGWLDKSLEGAGLIHLSGITVAILSPDARNRLLDALIRARSNGARVSFDPNVRPKLWSCVEETRNAMARFLGASDIALPSFDDEQALWGDVSPDEAAERFASYGVKEIVVKNGAGPVIAKSDGRGFVAETPSVSGICDTSGAGDAFNAGYLGGRLVGMDAAAAIVRGQKMSGEVICHFGARIPKGNIPLIG